MIKKEQLFKVFVNIKDDCVFILKHKHSKINLEKDCFNKYYSLENPIIEKFLLQGYNLGVLCGYNNLIVLDIDNKEIAKKIIQYLPKTFIVETRNGFHVYFKIDEVFNKKFRNKDTKKIIIEVLGNNTSVMSPGSIHPEGTEYKIFLDNPINNISKKYLLDLIYSFEKEFNLDLNEEKENIIVNKKNIIVNKKNIIVNKKGYHKSRIKQLITIKQLLYHFGSDTSKNPTNCCLGHTSNSNTCLSFDESRNVFNCFNCGVSGDIYTLYMKKNNCNFYQALEELGLMCGVQIK